MTFFGEIIIDNSRAIFDDEDENFEDNDDDELEVVSLKNEFNVLQGVKIIILLHGKVASELGKIYIIKDPIPKYKFVVKKKLLNCFELYSDTIVITCSESLLEDYSMDACKKILSMVEFTSDLRILILHTLPLVHYMLDVCKEETSILRGLKSKFCKDLLKCSILETPNLITGLPAAILTYSQFYNISCQLYILYTDKNQIDSVLVSKGLNVILSFLPSLEIPNNVEDRLKELHTFSVQNYLYC